jgi:RNA polymerase sigma factor (TIGR02999 family)
LVSESAFPLLYSQLRAMAQNELANERTGHTLDATALVHEAFLKLSAGPDSAWQSKAHFCAVAARAMRCVLVDHARTRGRLKRGGGADPARRESLAMIGAPDRAQPIDVLALDEALTRLAEQEPAAASVVEMRFFAGMEERVIGDALGISERTVRRHWVYAKAWLHRELSRPNLGLGGGIST